MSYSRNYYNVVDKKSMFIFSEEELDMLYEAMKDGMFFIYSDMYTAEKEETLHLTKCQKHHIVNRLHDACTYARERRLAKTIIDKIEAYNS